MDLLKERISSANVKALLIGKWNLAVVAVSVVAMIVLIASWAASIGAEGGGVRRRYAASILAFLFQVVVAVLSAVVQRAPPSLLLYYAHQAMCALALVLTALAMGMNDVVVNLCALRMAPRTTLCGAHYAELVGEVLVCLCMGLTFATTQQRIVVFTDKGILDGIKGRTNGMQQLP